MIFKICFHIFICLLVPLPFIFEGYKSAEAQTLPHTPGNDRPKELKIIVKEFKFVGNTVFSAEELGELTKPFTQKPLLGQNYFKPVQRSLNSMLIKDTSLQELIFPLKNSLTVS